MASRSFYQGELRRYIRRLHFCKWVMWGCAFGVAVSALFASSVPHGLFLLLGASALALVTRISVHQDRSLIAEAEEMIGELDGISDDEWDALAQDRGEG